MNKSYKNIIVPSLLVLCLTALFWGMAKADDTEIFQYQVAKDNVILALDISGSMKALAYRDTGAGNWKTGTHDDFDPDYDYYGYFAGDRNYSYDNSYGFFVENSSGPWDGNFLNWLAMRRIDVARKVLVGGKVQDRAGEAITGGTWVETWQASSNYVVGDVVQPATPNGFYYRGVRDGISGSGNPTWNTTGETEDGTMVWEAFSDLKWYVLLGQHEPYDYQFTKVYDNSDDYTPYGDNTTFQMIEGQIVPTLGGGDTVITQLNDTPGEMVEVGQISMDWDDTLTTWSANTTYAVGDLVIPTTPNGHVYEVTSTIADSGGSEPAWNTDGTATNDGGVVWDTTWLAVNFEGTYTNPVVVAKSLTYNGSSPVGVRITNITNTGFHVRLQEWDDLVAAGSGDHSSENIIYIVAEAGNYTVPMTSGNVLQVAAGINTTNNTGTNSWVSQNFQPSGGNYFMNTPVVFTSVGTLNEVDYVTVRNKDVSNSSFKFTMQEEEDNAQTHASEDVHWIGLSRVSGMSTNTGQLFEVGNTGNSVDENWDTVHFSRTYWGGVPLVLMDMQTTNGIDPANVRVAKSVQTANAIDVQVDEEKSSDTETGHANEEIGYLVVNGAPAFNIKVGVHSEPTGLIQEISEGIRFGLAVYNFDHTKNVTSIYTGNKVHGGNLHPCYPDVSLDADSRTNYDICLPTHVRAPLENIIRVIEEHPLVWGTTPIAETLYEIEGYVAQRDNNINGHTQFFDNGSTQNSYEVDPSWDPYRYPELDVVSDPDGVKVACARNYVLHLNDGAPYKDWDTLATWGSPPSGIGDYDNDSNPGPSHDGSGNKTEMLDDVALYLRQNDCRSDIDNNQEIITYYVYAALGEGEQNNSEARKMRESAVNGGFVDQDGDLSPDPAHPANFVDYINDGNCQLNEWDADEDCNPDNFYAANNGYELAEVLRAAFENIMQASTTFVSPGITVNQFNRLTHEDEIFLSLFTPNDSPRWVGNLKQYRLSGADSVLVDADDLAAVDSETGLFLDDARSIWSAADDGNEVGLGGAAGMLSDTHLVTRKVYTYTSGTAPDEVDLTQGAHEFDEDNANITLAMLDISGSDPHGSAEPYRTQLLKWARGVDVLDEDGDEDFTDARSHIGDPLHSKPVLITYGVGDMTVFFSTNEGFLHAINVHDLDTTQAGEELFAFIPKELLENLATFYKNSAADDHPYGLDGEIGYWQNDEDQDGIIEPADGDFVYIYVGMRRGGQYYYALDVTDRSAPKLKWMIDGTSGNFAELGQTWSKPIATQVKIAGETKDVVIFGGGYDWDQDDNTTRQADDQGRGIFMVDANDGSLLWWASHSDNPTASLVLPDMDYSIPSTVKVVDIDADGLADRMYVGDMGGQVWRFDIDNIDNTGAASLVTGGVIAEFSDDTPAGNRRFYNAPDVAYVECSSESRFFSVAIGSGYRAHPLNTTIEDRFYMIKDTGVVGTYTPITEANLFDVTDNVIGEGNQGEITAALTSLNSASGWILMMQDSSGSHVGEKVLSTAITFDNWLQFTTYIPGASDNRNCSVEQGVGNYYLVNICDATPGADLDPLEGAEDQLVAEDRSTELDRGGIPPEPTLMLPEESEDPVVLVGPEQPIDDVPFSNKVTRTDWQVCVNDPMCSY
ncbi:MAG: hypothetical protein HQL52_06570 [Magnetococcales bacterium]|nr:hypothetical protein [Magnetococcales bacterium]